MPEITITLSKEGLKVEGNGYKGTSCTAPITAIVNALGGNPADMEGKPELYESQVQSDNLTQSI